MENRQLFLVLSLLFCSLSVFGQLKVGTDGNIGMGTSVSTSEKVKLYNTTSSKSLSINSPFYVFGTKYGIWNDASNFVTSGGNIYGIWSRTGVGSSSSDFQIGIYGEVGNEGNGSKTAIRAVVKDDHTSAGGSGNWAGGFSAFATFANMVKMTGSSLWIDNKNPVSSDLAIGQEIRIYGTGAASVTGLSVEVPSGPNNYAAQFTGDVTVNGAMVLTSDRTLKQNIKDIPEALTIIERLNPKTYQYRGDTRFGFNEREQQFGFLAQDVEEILPSMVKDVRYPAIYKPKDVETEEGESTPDYFSEENRVKIHPAETYKAIKYTDFIPILVQAVKEQQTEIETLNTALDNPLNKSNTTGINDDNVSELIRENKQLKADLANLGSIVDELKTKIARIENCTDCFGDRRSLDVEVDNDAVAIYPNPAKAQVTINSKEVGAYQVKVMTTDGRLWMAERFESKVNTLNTTGWPAGTYLFEISTTEGIVLSREKVIIVD